MALNKGGRLGARVINASKAEFTVEIEGKGHEHHKKEMTFPVAMWQGPGAVVGEDRGVEPYDEKDPRALPHGGEQVIVDFDLLAKLGKKAAAA
jgi:hypothetical protein